MTFQSIPVSWEKNTSSEPTMPSITTTAAPPSAALTLETRSVAIRV